MAETLYERMQQQLINQEENKTTSSATTYDFLSDTDIAMGPDPDDLDRGFLGSLWRHALSSATLGATELGEFTRTEDWETKDTSERIGAAIGEFAGMFVPFAGLGKGLRAGVGAIKGGTKLAFKEATETAAGVAAKEVGGEAAEQATRRAIQKGIIDNGGETAFGNPKLFKQFHLGARFADNAIDMTGDYVGRRLRKEFSEAGLNYSDEAINNITKGFKTGLREGKYINSVEQWIEASWGINKMTPGLKKNIARWGAMGISESITLGLYNGISGMSMAGFRGDEYGSKELFSGLKHSVALGFAFPLVRGIFKGGGNLTLIKGGWNQLWRGYKQADYAKMATEAGGPEKLRLFIHSLTGGKTKNALSGFQYKLANGTLSTAPASNEAIAALSADDAVSILNQMRKYSTTKGMFTFGKEWLADMRQSSLRMVAGAMMNNTGLFYVDGEYSDSWLRMPKSETMTHLLIGAFFTRQRGAWNHNRKLSPELKDQYRLANALGLDTSGIEAMIRHSGQESDIKATGAGLSDDKVASKIYTTVEEHIVKANERNPLTERKDKTELNSGAERDLDKINHIYNAIKLFKGETTENLIDFRSMTPKERQELVTELGSIEIMRDRSGKAKYLKDFNMADVLDIVNIRMGKGGENTIIDFIKQISQNAVDNDGNPILQITEPVGEKEKLLVSSIVLSDGKETSRTSMAQLNELLNFLERNGVIEVDRVNSVSAETFYENPNNKNILNKIFQRTNDKIITQIFGPEQHIPSFNMFDQRMGILANIVKGKQVEALRLLHDIDAGKIENLDPSQQRLVENLKTIFTGEDGKLIGNFKQIRDNILKDSETGESLDKSDLSAEHKTTLAELELIFNSWILGKGNRGYTSKASHTMANINEVVKSFKNAGTGVAGQQLLTVDFLTNYTDYKMNRILNTYVSPEKAEIVRRLMENGEIRQMDDGNLEIATADAKYSQVLDKTKSKKEATLAREAWSEILDYIGYAGGKISHQSTITATGAFSGNPISLDSYKPIKTLQNMLPSVAAKYMHRDLMTAFDAINIRVDEDGNIDITANPLHGELKKLRSAIDSFATGEGSIHDLDVLVKKISDRFKDPSNKDRVIVHNGKEIKISNLLTQLQRNVTKAKNKSENAEKMFMTAIDEFADTGDLNLREAFDRLLQDEVTQAYEFQKMIMQLIYGVREKGLRRAATIQFTSELKSKLMEKLGYDSKKAPSLDQLLLQYNKSRSFYDLKNIVKQIQQSMAINAEVNMDRDNSIERKAAAFMERFSFKNHSVSLQGLSEKYSLQGLLNGEVIDPKFILKIQDGLINKDMSKLDDVRTQMRIRISSLTLDKAERKNLLRSFDEGDDILLIKALANMVTRPVVQINQGQLVFDENKAVTKGLGRDGFFDIAKDKYNIVDLYEVERTGVEDGRQKSIHAIDLNKVTSEYVHLTAEQYAKLKKAGKLKEVDLSLKKHIDPQNAQYIFVSKGRPLLVSAHADNLKNVSRWFTDWRLETLSNIDRKIDRARNEGNLERVNELKDIKDNFSKATEELSNNPTTKDNIGVKLTAIYWHNALPDMVENRFKSEFRGGGDMFKALQREDLKILKRLNLFEGGNLAPIDRMHMQWTAERLLERASQPGSKLNPDEIQATYDSISDRLNHGVNIITLADESSVFLLKDIVPAHYQDLYNKAIEDGNITQAKDLKYMIDDLKSKIKDGYMPSLEASSKNSVTYIDESMARLLSARDGVEFDPTQMNGWKPIVYHKDAQTGKLVAMKTWLVYSPTKAEMMRRTNTHVLTTESAAKVLVGESTSGVSVKKFKPRDHENWMNELETRLTDEAGNIISAHNSELAINLPIEAFSIGTNNTIEKGVTGSMSLINYQGREGAKALIEYQRIEYILSEIGGMSHDLLNNVRSEIAMAMYKHKSNQGGIKSFSDVQTLTEALLNAHVRTDDPLLKDGIERVFMSTTLQLLRKPKIDNGSTTYLIHDELPERLSNPIYGDVLDIVGDKANLRLILKQGGIAKPAHWGDDILLNNSSFRLVGEKNGIDIIFGMENGKLKAINPYDEINIKEGEYLTQDKDSPRKITTKEFEKQVKPLMDIIGQAIKAKIITNKGQLFDFLKNPEKYTISGAQPKKIRDLIKKLKIQISSMELAIPRKSADVIPTRVEQILDRGYGNHSIVNDYDLAVGHQRDFDMDHLYSHDALPFETMKDMVRAVGIQEDYQKQNTEPVNFSPFGEVDVANSTMGQSRNIPTIKDAARNMEIKKMAMGAAISMNQPLSWLSNTGFHLNVMGNTIKMNYSVSSENIRNVAGMISRIGNMTQAGVDAWQGDLLISKELEGNLWKHLIFGVNPSNSKAFKDSNYKYKPMFDIESTDYSFNSNEPGKAYSPAQKQILHDIVYTTIQTLKQAQGVFNDIYSDGAKQNITMYDIHKRYSQILNVFGSNKNEYIFRKLLKKYEISKDRESIDALYSVFFGGTAGEIKLRDQFNLEKIRDRIKKGNDISGINNIINFELPGKESSKLIGRHSAGVIFNTINQNKIYQHESTTSYPKGIADKTLSDAMDITRDLKGKVALLRAVGVVDLDNFSDPNANTEYSDFTVTLAPKLKQIEVRDIAYTELQNELRRIQNKIRQVKRFTKSETDAELLSLQDEGSTIEATMKLIEMRAVKDFGTNIEKNKQEIKKLNPKKDGSHTSWYNDNKKNPVSIYEIPFKIDVTDSNMLKNLVYGNSADNNGIKHITDLKPGHGFTGRRNVKYIILENPIISHHISEAESANAYAWSRLTNRVDLSPIGVGNTADVFLGDVQLAIDLQTNNHRARGKRIKAQKTRINSRAIYGEQGLGEDFNIISRLMRTWAGKGEGMGWDKIDDLDPGKVRIIALKLLEPRTVARHYTRAGGDNLPHLRMNNKVAKNLFNWLHEFKFIDVIIEDLKLKTQIYSNIKNNLNPIDIQKAERSLDLYEDNYWDKFESQLGRGAGDLVYTAMGDKFGVTGNQMAVLLKDKNIIKLSSGEQVHLLENNGVLSNGHANRVKYFKDGDLSKRNNYCRP